MSLKKIAALTIAAATTISLASCSGNSSDKKADDSGSSNASSSKTVRIWFMEGSISKKAQEYLKTEFEKENPGQKLSIETQPWKGIKAKMQTALASKDQSPDIVEIGTSTNPLAAAGALMDISSMYEKLGGKNLIPAFTKGGMYNGKHFSYPLYGGVRGVFYRKDLFKKAGIAVPKTLTELKDAAIKLQAANPDKTPNFSGMYLAGVDYHALESYLYATGGRYATKDGDKWSGNLESPKSQMALKQMQDIFKNGTKYALDSNAGQKQFQNYFNSGKVGMLIATGNIGQKIDKKLWDKGAVGVMALPSNTPGEVGATYAGGSNLALAKNGQNHKGAEAAMKVIYSKKFMEMLANDGWVPGNLQYADHIAGAFGPIAKEVMQHAVGVPRSLNFAKFYNNHALANFWARIAKLEDPTKVAKDMDDMINTELNKK